MPLAGSKRKGPNSGLSFRRGRNNLASDSVGAKREVSPHPLLFLARRKTSIPKEDDQQDQGGKHGGQAGIIRIMRACRSRCRGTRATTSR